MSFRPEKKKTLWQRWGFLIFPLFIVGFLGVGFLGIDQMCINDAERRLPFYPDALKVSEQSNGLRLRGVGNSLVILETDDSLEEVETWYEAHTLELLNAGQTRGLNRVSRWLETSAEGDTQIFYLSQCVM